MTKCLVFDFDGVIINSHDLQVQALRESYGKIVGAGEPPFAEFFKNSGDSLFNIFKKLKLPLEMLPHYLEISTKHMAMIKTKDDIELILKKFIEDGYQCAICTGKDRKRTLAILSHLNLDIYFKAVVCSDDVMQPKPASESLLKAVEMLNSCKDNAIMIGDGINDILCAKGAGITSIGVTWGDLSRDDIENVQPDYIVDTIQELVIAIQDKFKIKD